MAGKRSRVDRRISFPDAPGEGKPERIADEDGDVSGDEDPCVRCGRPRGHHAFEEGKKPFGGACRKFEAP